MSTEDSAPRPRRRRRSRRERRPRNLRVVERQGQPLRIEYSVPTTSEDAGRLAMSGFLCGVLAFLGLHMDAVLPTSAGGVLDLIRLLLVSLASAAMGYVAVTSTVNKVVITVDGRQLRVRGSPLPSLFGLTLRSPQIAQLYCTPENGIEAKLRGETVTVLTGLETLDEARTIEAKIEEYLEIQNVPVPGEARGERSVKDVQRSKAGAPEEISTPLALSIGAAIFAGLVLLGLVSR